MAIGDTVQAGLMRIDSSPILLAGQAQARANQAFGDAIGGVVEKFYQKKKEKQEREQRERAYREMGFSAEEAKAASGDKDLANQFINKMNADRNYQLRLEDFAIRKKAFDSQQDMLDEQKATNQSLAKFMMQPVETPTPEFSALQREYRPEQIPGTPEFIAMQEEPIPARPSIIAKTITEQPDFQRFVKQDSPAVDQLPDSVKHLGRSIQDKVQSGELTNQAGMMAINNLVGPELSPSDKLARDKFDYEKAKDGLENKEKGKPTANLAYTDATLNAISDAESILKNSVLPSTGFWGNALKEIGGTPAADLRSSIKTITSAIGFDKLQDMRDRSQTGGALGQVSERELAQLNASLGSLEQSQSKKQFKANLARVKEYYQKYYKATMAQVKAYERGMKFETEKEAMSWYDKNFPTGGKPSPNNQTNITTPGGFNIRKN